MFFDHNNNSNNKVQLWTNIDLIDEFNTLFSISILSGDPEARECNLFLSGTLHGLVKFWMAETTLKIAALLFLYEIGLVLNVYHL